MTRLAQRVGHALAWRWHRDVQVPMRDFFIVDFKALELISKHRKLK